MAASASTMEVLELDGLSESSAWNFKLLGPSVPESLLPWERVNPWERRVSAAKAVPEGADG